jgi:hypothetical protein
MTLSRVPVPGLYHVALADEQLDMLERMAFNHRRDKGAPLPVPELLFLELRERGADTRHMQPDPRQRLEGFNDSPHRIRDQLERELTPAEAAVVWYNETSKGWTE